MIRRTMDAGHLNAVVNHPSVRPFVMGEGELDLTQALADPGNYAWQTEHGGFVLMRHSPGVYEVHSMFLPEGRGASALKAARDMLRQMFAATDCREVLTKIPNGNKGADGLARATGFREWFKSELASYRRLTLAHWMMNDSGCLEAGRVFHDFLEDAKVAAKSALVTHEDDEAHDRAAGCAALMAEAGNPVKAVETYNHWARLAGYRTIKLLSTRPPVIDVIDAVLTVRAGELEVLQCR